MARKIVRMGARLRQLDTRQILIVGLLLVMIAAFDVLSVRHKSRTYDEFGHLRYGWAVLHGHTDRLDDSKMPVTALNALGVLLSQRVLPDPELDVAGQVRIARLVTVLFAVLLGAIVFSWSHRVYGFEGGILSLVVFLFAPNIQAHARLVTTDLYAAVFIVLSMYTLWLFTLERRWWRALICSCAVGLSLLAKFSAVLLFPVIAVVMMVRYAPVLVHMLRKHEIARAGSSVIRGLGWLSLIAAASLVPLNAGYLFNGTWTPLADYDFRSSDFDALQERMGPLAEVPLPLPRPFVEGLDMVRHNEVSGSARGPAYLFGRAQRQPFAWYYAAVFLLKVPLATQILVLVAAATVIKLRSRRQLLENELFFVIPALLFAAYFNLVCAAQMGIRLAIMVLPFGHVLCGALGQPALRSRRTGVFVVLMLLFLAVSVLSYYPHLLSYHNELAGHRRTTYRLLADSNLDWGQNEFYAEIYLRTHPATIKNPPEPVAGEILVSANLLTGVVHPGRYPWYEWLRGNLEPVDHVAYSYLVFRVTPEDLAAAKKAGAGNAH